MVNRVATYPFTNTLIAENMRLQVKYADINTQISSGLKSQDYKGIARDSQYLLAVESSADKLEAYNANANITLSQINTMYTTMARLQDIANSILHDITASLGGDLVPSAVLTNQATIGMNEAASLLNLTIAGRHVFAGSDIDTPPVDLTDPGWIAQTPPSVANTSYYQGNAVVNAVQVSESLTISYGVKADNPAFEQLLRAFNLIANNPGNTAALVEASGLVQQSVDDIANVQGVLSSQSRSIEDQIDKNTQDRTYIKDLASTIKEVDIPSASVYLTEIQTQLEAAYTASVRILNMSLTKYL